MTPPTLTVVDRIATVEEYLSLRDSVGWTQPPRHKCHAALTGSAFGVVVLRDGRTVGMGRVFSDGALYATIADIVVAQGHQGLGIGRQVMDRLIDWITTSGIPHAGLVADDAVAEYYTRWPFRDSGRYLRLWTS